MRQPTPPPPITTTPAARGTSTAPRSDDVDEAKLFVLYLIMGVGANIALRWGDLLLAAADNMTPAIYLEIVGGSLVFVLLPWTVPSTVTRLIVRALSLSLADAVMSTTMGT